ncbi:hypothetical protein Btru_061181 [Bulinus truncatus]|nr:hypothetical protein Btru_061181 [Bulinus truncatus]
MVTTTINSAYCSHLQLGQRIKTYTVTSEMLTLSVDQSSDVGHYTVNKGTAPPHLQLANFTSKTCLVTSGGCTDFAFGLVTSGGTHGSPSQSPRIKTNGWTEPEYSGSFWESSQQNKDLLRCYMMNLIQNKRQPKGRTEPELSGSFRKRGNIACGGNLQGGARQHMCQRGGNLQQWKLDNTCRGNLQGGAENTCVICTVELDNTCVVVTCKVESIN